MPRFQPDDRPAAGEHFNDQKPNENTDNRPDNGSAGPHQDRGKHTPQPMNAHIHNADTDLCHDGTQQQEE